MKRVLVMLLLLPILVMAQELPAANWGTKIPMGTQFRNTDSLKVKSSSLRDTLFADTLYSSVIPIPEAGTIGLWRIVNYFTELSSEAGTVDSVTVEVRFHYAFTYPQSNGIMNLWGALSDKPASRPKFTDWYKVGLFSADVLNRKKIAESDSSWWQPANGRQFRVYVQDASTDTLLYDLSDYLD